MLNMAAIFYPGNKTVKRKVLERLTENVNLHLVASGDEHHSDWQVVCYYGERSAFSP